MSEAVVILLVSTVAKNIVNVIKMLPHSFVALVLVVCLLLPISVLSQGTAVIGTWNLGGNNVPDLTPEQIRKLAEAISLFEPDLLVLTEVDRFTAIDDLAQRLHSDFSLSYDSLIIDQDQTNLDIGILFKDRVEVSGSGLVDGSDLGSTLRKAFWADVAIVQFDFRLIGVHFKSAGGSTNVKKRRAQAKIVAAFVKQSTEGVEKDVLLLGDYNMFPRRDGVVFAVLSAGGFLRFVSSEDLCSGPDLNTCVGTHIQGSGSQARVGNLLDGFAISKDHTGEFQGQVSRVDLPQMMGLSLGDFKTDVTDHYPIIATFKINQDDDGNATGDSSTSDVRMIRLLPSPQGNDTQNEEVTIKNFGSSPVSLEDWMLRDLAGRTWFLDELGTLNPGQEKTIRRNGQEMALNNRGDIIDLIEPSGAVVQRVRYPRVSEGEIVTP